MVICAMGLLLSQVFRRSVDNDDNNFTELPTATGAVTHLLPDFFRPVGKLLDAFSFMAVGTGLLTEALVPGKNIKSSECCLQNFYSPNECLGILKT